MSSDKKIYDTGVFFTKNKGWRAQIIIGNNQDMYYTHYFSEYNEAAEEYNRVLKELIKRCGKKQMFKLRLPTKLLSTELPNKNIKRTEIQKKTRSGKIY